MSDRARRWLADRLRSAADRIDPHGAPRRGSPWSFTFEPGVGVVFNEEGRGCPIWYLGEDDFKRAHTEALAADRAHIFGGDDE